MFRAIKWLNNFFAEVALIRDEQAFQRGVSYASSQIALYRSDPDQMARLWAECDGAVTPGSSFDRGMSEALSRHNIPHPADPRR